MTERPASPKMKMRKAPAEERPRIGAPRQIADLMPDIGRAAFRKFGFVQSSIVTRWTDIVGPHYAAVSAPESNEFQPRYFYLIFENRKFLFHFI